MDVTNISTQLQRPLRINVRYKFTRQARGCFNDRRNGKRPFTTLEKFQILRQGLGVFADRAFRVDLTSHAT